MPPAVEEEIFKRSFPAEAAVRQMFFVEFGNTFRLSRGKSRHFSGNRLHARDQSAYTDILHLEPEGFVFLRPRRGKRFIKFIDARKKRFEIRGKRGKAGLVLFGICFFQFDGEFHLGFEHGAKIREFAEKIGVSAALYRTERFLRADIFFRLPFLDQRIERAEQKIVVKEEFAGIVFLRFILPRADWVDRVS